MRTGEHERFTALRAAIIRNLHERRFRNTEILSYSWFASA